MLKKYEKMESTDGPTPALGGGTWKLDKKHFIKLDHAKITCVTYQTASSLLVVGLDSGIFGIYDMPGCTNIHTLSISQHGISTVAINGSGEWLAFGSSALGQLLVASDLRPGWQHGVSARFESVRVEHVRARLPALGELSVASVFRRCRQLRVGAWFGSVRVDLLDVGARLPAPWQLAVVAVLQPLRQLCLSAWSRSVRVDLLDVCP